MSCFGNYLEEFEPSYIAAGKNKQLKKKVQSLWVTVCQFLKELNIYLPWNPSQLLGIYFFVFSILHKFTVFLYKKYKSCLLWSLLWVSYFFMDFHVYEIRSVFLLTLSYVDLIIRPGKESGMEERKRFLSLERRTPNAELCLVRCDCGRRVWHLRRFLPVTSDIIFH